ncbi:RNA polymerase sigma factor [Streptomyces mirabilis]|uniref:RNA polymerase sigma factor n=1 Tax=Streptomyces mirabilis TaxID=68239 RepID=UPI0021BE8D4B|nr:sigma-70 family RNA polymerase sigma factor [Streptomyces mirabilis]MCT9113317.1 sigma-70 family RNA polymerase sigma factor [Streptomyces mirabilis]
MDEEFSHFYRATIRALTGFLVNQGAPLPEAADIAQDTMTQAYRRWTELRAPRAWVHTVASRTYIRRLNDVREEPVDPPPEPTSLLLKPNGVAEWEARHDVLQQIWALPPRQRQVLAWTISEYTPTEIAEQLGLTPEAVRASLMKARRALTGNSHGEEDQ